MVIPSERNKKIIKLCKGHHSEDTTLIAIQKFVSERCGLEFEQVSPSTIYGFLLDTMNELFEKEKFIRFIKQIFVRKDNVHYTDVIFQMISEIANTRVHSDDGNTLIDLSII